MAQSLPTVHRTPNLSWDDGVRWTVTVISVVASLWVIYYAHDNILPRRQHANIIIGAGVAVYYFTVVLDSVENDSKTLQDKFLILLSLVVGLAALAVAVYIHIHFERWQTAGRILIYNRTDLLVGAFLIVVVTHMTFREFGRVLGGIVVFSMIYAYFGGYLPGILAHSGLTVEEIIVRQSVLLTGIFGFLMQVGATWIAIFLIFAGLVKGYDGFEYIIRMSAKIQDRSNSGVAQMAVVASSIMGTMLGSSAANVATTGSFTIPTMKDSGLTARFSAAVESAASTGGQILPPIMGAAAFLMADILGIPFAQVAIAGVLPAFLFYLTVSLSIHLKIGKHGWFDELEETGPDTGEDPPAVGDPGESEPAGRSGFDWKFVFQGMQYALPLVALIYILMILQYGPMRAGLYTIIVLVVCRVGVLTYFGTPQQIVPDTVAGFQEGFGNLAMFVGILASLGIVIDLFSFTGLAQRISISLVILSGGVFVFILILVMVTSLLFGLGMPTPAAYVLVATILAPSLVQFGVTNLTAHMFVFYFALLSAITPPVAVAVAIAVGISGSNFVETCIETLRLCVIGFLIPFIFLANPELIHWSAPETAISIVLVSIGSIAAVLATMGYNGRQHLGKIDRVLFAIMFVAIVFSPVLLAQLLVAVAFVPLARYPLTSLIRRWR